MSDSIEKRVPSSARVRQRRRWLHIYTIFDFLIALSFILMPLVLADGKKVLVFRYLLASVFWIGLAGLILTAVYINISRRNSSTFARLIKGKKKIGFMHFFQNRYATVADTSMFVSLLAVIILEWIAKQPKLAISIMGVFIFCFNMHCMLNGICYEYINYKIRSVNNDENRKKSLGE